MLHQIPFEQATGEGVPHAGGVGRMSCAIHRAIHVHKSNLAVQHQTIDDINPFMSKIEPTHATNLPMLRTYPCY